MKDERRPAVTKIAPPLPPRPDARPSVPDDPPVSGRVALDVQPVDAAAFSPPGKKVDPYVGKTIDGRYLIEAVLGEGGMGIVYRGRHKVIDKKVAIKVLRGDMAKDSEITERFLQEARAASAIGNPHIIDISDFGQLPDGSTYFVMEFLDGKSLSDVMNESRPIPVNRLCHIAKQIAQGLSAAHAAKIIHRDLKPDNIMLIDRGTERDFVKILDFGIAKVGTAGSKMTKAGSVFGTPHYMSPEQAAGAVVDLRTDVYALGVILYEMASGKVPFDADNFMGILTQHMYKAPVPIRALVPEVDVPPGLDAVILKSLTKKPEGRYASMDGLLADLEKLEKGLMPDAVQEMMARSGGFNVPADYFRASAMPAPVPATPAGVPTRRWPLYVAIAAVASAVGVVGVIFARSSTTSAAASNTTTQAAAPKETATTPAAPTTTTSVAPTTPPTPSVAVATKAVMVVVTPEDAHVFRDGNDLGQQPKELHLAADETASIVLSRDGYESQIVSLTAAKNRQAFTLKKTPPTFAGGRYSTGPATTAKPAATTQPTSRPTSGGGVDGLPVPSVFQR